MGWHEWPLMLFTVIAQTAVGAFWFCSLALLAERVDVLQKAKLQQAMLVIWIMMIVAFVMSSFHLGSPWRGINAILRVGQAPLSNEIMSGGLFCGLGILHWLSCRYNKGSDLLRKWLLGLALICSVIFLWSMARFYMMPTVPTWDTPLTPIAFALTALMAGSALTALLFNRAGVTGPVLCRLPMIASGALVLALAVTLLQATSLGQIQTSVHRAVDLSPDYAMLMILRFALLLAAIGLWWRQVRHSSAGMALVCVGLIMLAELIGRGVFYALYMTVGLL